MTENRPYRIIISGGGTGGHIFPAVAIANRIRELYPQTEILFVGAKGKMEMQRVPEAGYKIIGLWISGLQRKLTLKNLLFPIKVVYSTLKARSIVSRFKPDVAIGVGGYASGPLLRAAADKGIPCLIQEQNSYAGLTNKWLGERAKKVCVAYDGMERFFPREKIVITGNPVRKDMVNIEGRRQEALSHFGLSASRKVLFAMGGSLGARMVNESILAGLQDVIDSNVQLIWQVGKFYYDEIKEKTASFNQDNLRIKEFVKEMDLAYAAADVVISRAGALSISELCLVKKPVIFVPSANVAEDHQTKNAMALVEKDAALMVPDREATERLVREALSLIYDNEKCTRLADNIGRLGKPNATDDIVKEVMEIIK